MEVFVHNADILCEQLEQYSGKGEFDIFEHLSKYTLDTICGEYFTDIVINTLGISFKPTISICPTDYSNISNSVVCEDI